MAPFVPLSHQVEGTDRMDGVRFWLLPGGHGQQQEARRKGGKDSDCQMVWPPLAHPLSGCLGGCVFGEHQRSVCGRWPVALAPLCQASGR